MVGGSAMYIDTFLSCQTKTDHSLTPQKNPEIYEKLKEMIKGESLEERYDNNNNNNNNKTNFIVILLLSLLFIF